MYKRKMQGWLKHLDFAALDLCCLQIAYLVAYAIRHGGITAHGDSIYLTTNLAMLLIDMCVMAFFLTMKNVLKRGYYSEFTATIKHVCLVVLMTAFYLFVTKESSIYSRYMMLMIAIMYAILGFVTRILWKKIILAYMADSTKRSLIIVTVNSMVDQVVTNIRNHNYDEFKIAGVVILDADRVGDVLDGDIQVVANKDTVAEYVCREWVDEVFLNIPDGQERPKKLMDQFMEMGVVVHLRLAKSEDFSDHIQFVERFGIYTVLTTSINCATPMQAFLKRAMDIAGGLAGCLITGILYLFLAPAIKSQSPGPVFFSQVRVGKNGKKFKMYKFRSMYMDAEERKKELMAQNRVKDGFMFKLDWDPRIIGTKKLPDGTIKKGVGNYIRDWSLDEFPQFFNVLKGDMSLVGTRPPTVDEWDKYDLHHRARLAMRPGVTGMWQVSGRSNITDFEDVVKLDIKYIREWSMGLDLRILIKTVLVVFKKEGSM